MKNPLTTFLLVIFLGTAGLAQNSILQGRVMYDNTVGTPLAGITINLLDLNGIVTSTTTSVAGYYYFNVPNAGTYTLSAVSSNPSAGVNSLDALLIARKYLGLTDFSGLKLAAADVVRSGFINSTDALLVQKMYSGNISSFPDGDWVFEQFTVNLASNSTMNKDIKGISVGDVDGSNIPPSAPGTPCPSQPFVVYGGQLYNTVQIGSQCWMRENMNIGTMINSSSSQTNNTLIEKYCYNNDNTNCNVYGGLYQWDELMKYTTVSGAQGICPTGWHVPTDAEWCSLSTYLDPTVSCAITNLMMGTNVGSKLKETGSLHWVSPNAGATNEYGFSAIGSGERNSNAAFAGIKTYAVFWTSTNSSPNPYYWYMRSDSPKIDHYNHSYNSNAWAVRCIKN